MVSQRGMSGYITDKRRNREQESTVNDTISQQPARGHVRRRPLNLLAAVAGLLVVLAAVAPATPRPAAAASSGSSTIAYVRADTGDEIRLIDPDGSNNRLLWSHGDSDPFEVLDVWSLAWRPDGSELAFVSSHEFDC